MFYRTLLRELVIIAESLSEGRGYLARAYFKLSRLYSDMQKPQQATDCLHKAYELRREICPADDKASLTEADFSALCPWMLW